MQRSIEASGSGILPKQWRATASTSGPDRKRGLCPVAEGDFGLRVLTGLQGASPGGGGQCRTGIRVLDRSRTTLSRP